jgi:hypothetical protein
MASSSEVAVTTVRLESPTLCTIPFMANLPWRLYAGMDNAAGRKRPGAASSSSNVPVRKHMEVPKHADVAIAAEASRLWERERRGASEMNWQAHRGHLGSA